MAEIDPDVLKNLKDLDALVDENGKISQENSSRFNELKNKIGELQQDKKPENRLEIVTGSDGTLELRKGEEPVLPDEKAYGKFVSNFKILKPLHQFFHLSLLFIRPFLLDH